MSFFSFDHRFAAMVMTAFKKMVLCSVLVVGAGCASCPCSTWSCKLWEPTKPAQGNVTTVMTYWDNRVRFVPDTVNNGATLAGIAGKVLLISEELENAQMLDADGVLAIELFDVSTAAARAEPVKLEEWRFDPQTLKRLKNKDAVGEGYGLFLPWASYRPEIHSIKLVVTYHPAAGGRHFADPIHVSLRADEPMHIQRSQIVHSQYQTPAKK